MSKTYIVAGAGFRGFCDAMELAKIPGAAVHVIDPAPFFGGIAYSRPVKGFFVDKGVHVFDSIPQPLADIVSEIMDGRVRTIDFISRSAFNGKVTEGFSLPDLDSLDDENIKAQIKKELLEITAKGKGDNNPTTLEELFYNRYGKTAGKIYCDIFKKVYSIDAAKVEPQGLSQTSQHRLKFLSDEKMVELKKDAWLDTILAARRQNMGKIDDLVSIYPDTGEAMRGWCDRAAEWLKAKGVKIHLGEKIVSIKDHANGVTLETDKQTIEADKIVWANDNVASLSAALGFADKVDVLQHGTPMVFTTLITQADKIENFTYLQNFDPEGRTYRTAAAGIFGNQIKPDGTSFITCECPVAIGSPRWENSDAMLADVWAECQNLGLVAQDATLVDGEALRIPSTFKLPLLGYNASVDEFRAEIPKRSQRVVLRNVVPFFRREIYLDSLNVRSLVE